MTPNQINIMGYKMLAELYPQVTGGNQMYVSTVV